MGSQDDVLRDLVNREPGAEDDLHDDFALAKMLQEQERAFFHARGMENGEFSGYAQLRDDPADGLAEGSSSEGEARGDDEDVEEELGVAEVGGEGGDPNEPIDDAELARRLHIQEEMELHRRMLELAGIHPEGEEEYTDEDDEAYLTDDSVDPDEMTYEELRALGDAVGVVSRGASVDVIAALPLARYPAGGGLAAGVAGVEEQCVVCRMEFEAGEDVKLLPCGHVFHPDCVDQWLAINKVCPICSKEVTAGGSSRAADGGGGSTKSSKA